MTVASKASGNDKQMQNQIMQSVHDDDAGGCHFGRDKTKDKVASGMDSMTTKTTISRPVRSARRYFILHKNAWTHK